MIQAKELMIGNLVLIGLKSGSGRKVESRIGVYDLERIIERPESTTFTYEPIPITEEWLINKAGFEETYNSKYRKRFDHKVYNFIGFDFSYMEDKSMEGFRYWGNFINIQYVHQLQNIYFALTQKELEIK
jgi:hypothetical protein